MDYNIVHRKERKKNMSSRPLKNKKRIYMEPITKVLEKINKSEKGNLVLLGDEGAGKSVILDEYLLGSSKEHPIVNLTTEHGEFVHYTDEEVRRLMQVALVLKKILLYVQETYPNQYIEVFANFDEKVKEIRRKIRFLYMVQNYSYKTRDIDSVFLKNPEILIEEFLNLAIKHLDYQTMTTVIDNFDTTGSSSKFYQQYMYNLLSQYFKLVITVSDKKVINNEKKQIELSENNDVILVDYTYDAKVVREILRTVFIGDFIDIEESLSDEILSLMAKKTQGNLFDMMAAIRYLLSQIDNLTKEEYEVCLINHIDKEINKNPIFTGRIKLERTLHI